MTQCQSWHTIRRLLCLFLHLCFSAFPKCPLGNLSFPIKSRYLGPNPYPDLLSPLYVIVHPRKLIHRILLFAASRKECHIDRSSSYHFRVMAVWNLSQDSHKARAPPRPPRPRPHPLPHVQMLYIQAERPLRLLVSRLEVVATWRRKLVLQCVVLRLRFDSVALELLCIF